MTPTSCAPAGRWDREQKAWASFGVALVALAAALLALIAVWLIQSSRARLAIDARDRLESELRTAREERGTMISDTQRAGAAAEESARHAAESAAGAAAAVTELARARGRLSALEARVEAIAQSIADPTGLAPASLAELLGPDPALALRVFVESNPPHERVTSSTLEQAVRELVPAKRFALDDTATFYLVLSAIHERSGSDSSLSLMLCVEGPLWTPGSLTLPVQAAGDGTEEDDGRQAWVRLWCRHTLGSAPTETLAALSRGLANELLDLLSSEFAPRPPEPDASHESPAPP